jgi:hypothetical protein
MATGQKAKDIFTRTTGRPEVGLEVAPRDKGGRPKAAEAYDKLSICLSQSQTIWLDRVALEYRALTGKNTNRAEIIRALVKAASRVIFPERPEDAQFEATVRELLEGDLILETPPF